LKTQDFINAIIKYDKFVIDYGRMGIYILINQKHNANKSFKMKSITLNIIKIILTNKLYCTI
jgi:hypothetical protein